MLLLNEPKRFSTDIDIIVPPDTNIDEYIKKAGQIFPFFHVEENFRKKNNNIQKRHFKFLYISPINENPVTVLLDVLFEENHYASIIRKPITNKLIITEGSDVEVALPDINCILGDKLTAFAPHTTGININDNKELEIIKQLFDCACLIREITDFSRVKQTYKNILQLELAYRGLNLSSEEVLLDTINSAAVIIGQGSLIKSNDFNIYSKGIRAIGSHIFSKQYNFTKASFDAALVMYFATNILNNSIDFKLIDDFSRYKDVVIKNLEFKSLNLLKKINLETFSYTYEACKNL